MILSSIDVTKLELVVFTAGKSFFKEHSEGVARDLDAQVVVVDHLRPCQVVDFILLITVGY